jgi:hypothetical protein
LVAFPFDADGREWCILVVTVEWFNDGIARNKERLTAIADL